MIYFVPSDKRREGPPRGDMEIHHAANAIRKRLFMELGTHPWELGVMGVTGGSVGAEVGGDAGSVGYTVILEA